MTLSLVSALAQTSRNAAMKSLGHKLDEYINVLGRFVFLLPFAAVAVAATGVPEIRPSFWAACALFAFAQTAATLTLSKALLYGKIGVVTSIWKLSIIWLVLLSYFTLGEAPSAWGLAGVLVAFAGVYFLNASRARVSPWEPVRLVLSDKGLRYGLISSFLYAPSVICFKWAAVSSSAAFGTLGTYAAASLLMLPIALRQSARHFRQVPAHWKGFAGMGFFAFVNSYTLAEAYRLTLTSYVESVKQTEILFAIAMGYLFFRERERLGEALMGGGIVLAGLVLVILGG